MADIVFTEEIAFEFNYPIVVIGGGGCGLCAALAAKDAGAEVLLIERDTSPMGTTSMSTGLIPAAGTPEQKALGIHDTPEIFAADILAKTKNEADAEIVTVLARGSAETVQWLRDDHHVNLTLIDGFLYPGHTHMRMYGMPNRSGAELMGALNEAVTRAGIDILTDALADRLFATRSGRILGVEVTRPNGDTEQIGCEMLILACCGFAGDRDLVAKHIPELENAVFHGHPGNKGHAIIWGEALGASLEDMGSYQGHGGLAYGHGIPILWPLIMEGGVQINCAGERFSDETQGYSEQAVNVLDQPGSVAWSVYDAKRHELMEKFDDYQDGLKAGAIKSADTLTELAQSIGVPSEPLIATIQDVNARTGTPNADRFGRSFSSHSPLQPRFFAAKVTGALFHTQGGLSINPLARVVRQDGTTLPNLYAGGGAARGISGSGASGYMAGNGLLTATSLGKIAGRDAAAQLLARK